MGTGFLRSAVTYAGAGWPAVLAVGAAALWGLAITTLDPSRMTDLGLVSVLPPLAYAALLLLTVSFCASLHRRQTPAPVLFLHVLLLVAMIHATPAIVYGTLRYSWAWKHVGIVDYILRHGSVDPGAAYLSGYHSWPGFFAMAALAVSITGASSAIGMATWAPPVYNLLFVGGLLFVLRAFTDDRRLLWLSAWFFVAANWVGQDYFSPQATVYFLNLVILGVLLRGFGQVGSSPFAAVTRWRVARPVVSLARRFFVVRLHDPMVVSVPQPAERVGLLAIVIALFVVIVASHPLTPFWTTLAVTGLVIGRRCTARGLPLLMAVLTVTWIVLVARPFLEGNLQWIVKTILDPFGNLDSNFIDLSRGSAGQRTVALVDRALTAAVAGLAALGCCRRLRLGHLDLAGIVLVLAPLPLIVANSYGGEMVFRIYFFALPFAAFFAAALLYPTRASGTSWRTTGMAIVISGVLLAGLMLAYYGKDRMYYFTPAEVQAAEYLTDTAPVGSLWVDGTWDWPLQYRNYEYYDYTTLTTLPPVQLDRIYENPVGGIASVIGQRPYPAAYMVITRSQKAEVEMTGVMRAGSLDRIEMALRESDRFRVVFENGDAVIFRFVPVTHGVGP